MAWKKILLEGDAAVLSDVAPLDVKKQTASAGTATEAARQDHLHNLDLSLSGLDELGAPTGPVDMNGQRLTGLGAPTTVGDAIPADVNLRSPDSTLLEGSTKAEVQNHAPQAHAASHKLAGADVILLHELGLPTGAVDFNHQNAAKLVLDVVASHDESPVEGQIDFLTTDDHPYVYVAA